MSRSATISVEAHVMKPKQIPVEPCWTSDIRAHSFSWKIKKICVETCMLAGILQQYKGTKPRRQQKNMPPFIRAFIHFILHFFVYFMNGFKNIETLHWNVKQLTKSHTLCVRVICFHFFFLLLRIVSLVFFLSLVLLRLIFFFFVTFAFEDSAYIKTHKTKIHQPMTRFSI